MALTVFILLPVSKNDDILVWFCIVTKRRDCIFLTHCKNDRFTLE